VDWVLFFVDSKLEFLQAFVTFYEFLIEHYEFCTLCTSAIQVGVLDMQRYFQLCHWYSHAQGTEIQILYDVYHIVIHLENLKDHLHSYQ
jgi:hypothetical protein